MAAVANQPQFCLVCNSTGRTLSRFTPAFSIDNSRTLTIQNDQLILVDSSGVLHRLDRQGRELWSARPQAGQLCMACPGDELLVLSIDQGAGSSSLRLLAADGRASWQHELADGYGGNLTIDKEKIWYVNGAGAVRCLDHAGNEIASPLDNQLGFCTDGVLQLSGYPVLSFGGRQLATDGSGSVAAVDSSGFASVLDGSGRPLLETQRMFDYKAGVSLDSRHDRVILVSNSGYRVTDCRGNVKLSEDGVNAQDAFMLDRAHRHFILKDDHYFYCFEY